jgi:hypothetical protein
MYRLTLGGIKVRKPRFYGHLAEVGNVFAFQRSPGPYQRYSEFMYGELGIWCTKSDSGYLRDFNRPKRDNRRDSRPTLFPSLRLTVPKGILEY